MTGALRDILLGLILAPLLSGIINRVKAVFAGRQGRPLLQLYFDLAKLLAKGVVRSQTASFVFSAGPILALACPVVVLAILPLRGQPALLSFPGDFVLAACLLGLARLAVILAALDVGSSFEGMGASREASFGALSEPVLFLTVLAAAGLSGDLSLAGILSGGGISRPEAVLAATALFMLLLTENARIPVDDPNTHLELTMIHEVMILDHSGPDLAFLEYGAALKLWIFCALTAGLLLPAGDDGALSLPLMLGGVAALAAAVGLVESTMARLKMASVPKLLAVAWALAALALILALWR